ncbi:MAG: tRNA pseudouridine(55) synthase TruB [Synergistaceae bacterium]
MQISGILPINKPINLRSAYCVDLVKRALGRKVKVGHGGTLDSTASGLLIVLIGQATRLSNFVMDLPKEYEVTLKFGEATSTDDFSGEVIQREEWKHITDSKIDEIIPSYLGWRMQTPPVVSAVHVNGKRAHRLFRDGEDVALNPKPVYFKSISRISDLSAQGEVSFRIFCRRGTYIRSFVRDIAFSLQSVAYVQKLCRVTTGSFNILDSLSLREKEDILYENIIDKLLPLSAITKDMNTYELDDCNSKRIIDGLQVSVSQLKRKNFSGGITTDLQNIALYSEKVLSIATMKREYATLNLCPQVNIIMNRGEIN